MAIAKFTSQFVSFGHKIANVKFLSPTSLLHRQYYKLAYE